MSTHTNSRPVIVLVLLSVLITACGGALRETPTRAVLLTLVTSTPLPASPTPLPSSTPFPATSTPTPIPLPTPTPTSVIPLACPPPGDPAPPERPDSFDDYPETLAAYLSAGGSAQGLERLLRDWGAITEDVGDVRSLDMTGDMDQETVVVLIDPAPEFQTVFASGDVVIFQCQEGAVVPVYRERDTTDQQGGDVSLSLFEVEDVNDTGRADVVYATSTCGAHTCWGRLYIIEWDGMGFVDRIPAMSEYPYPTFDVGDGQVRVDVGGVGSAGAGFQRSHSETWAWDGKVFTATEQITGPPTALIHYIHDGDEALAQGDYGEAITYYQGALGGTLLPTGLFLENEDVGVAIIQAYARFKLVVAFAASGDGLGAQAQYDLLMTEHPEETPGYPYALLGQAFWGNFVTDEALDSACEAVVVLAESDPVLAENLYAGYANPDYEPADLCRVGR